jgi:membrane-associated phospholipid phosphatase
MLHFFQGNLAPSGVARFVTACAAAMLSSLPTPLADVPGAAADEDSRLIVALIAASRAVLTAWSDASSKGQAGSTHIYLNFRSI